MLLAIAVLLTGIWIALTSQEPVSSGVTLIFGIVVAVLAAIELLRPYAGRAP
jgi:hypothetical protein